MSQQQPEVPESDVELFDQGLIKEPLDVLEQYVQELPQLLSDKPLEFLQGCKACVDARLDAEPAKKVYMNSPHERRVQCWMEIQDRLEAEITWRSRQANQGASTLRKKELLGPGAKEQPSVAARRTIVRQNCGVPDKELCEMLDREKIGLPRGWPEAGYKTWSDAWRERKSRIQVILSKDRKSG